MAHRFACAVFVGLLLLQSSLLASAAMALDAGQTMAECGSQMGSGDDDCPCCPQGISTSAGCAVICFGVLAGFVSSGQSLISGPEHTGLSPPSALLASQIYVPVNPPPIT